MAVETYGVAWEVEDTISKVAVYFFGSPVVDVRDTDTDDGKNFNLLYVLNPSIPEQNRMIRLFRSNCASAEITKLRTTIDGRDDVADTSKLLEVIDDSLKSGRPLYWERKRC
jgi:hypothetical protein